MIDHLLYISIVLIIGYYLHDFIHRAFAQRYVKQTWCKINCKIFKSCEMRKGGIDKNPIWCNYYNDINKLDKLKKERGYHNEQ